MKHVIYGDRELWVGVHKKLGAIIFDPVAQGGIAGSEVRLFKIEDQSSATFIKSFLANSFRKFNEAEWQEIESSVSDYSNSQANRRVTHCFKCKAELNSVDFSFCKKCKWIKCFCGACGCSYDGFKKDNQE